MNDFQRFLADEYAGKVQIFPFDFDVEGARSAPSNALMGGELWVKPEGVSIAVIIAIGAGGGGGGGYTGATGTNRTGGGGGGNGAITKLVLPAILLPDRMRISCGVGGAGGNAGSPPSAGSDGGVTYIWVGDDGSSAHDYLLQADSGKGGPPGNNTASNTGGGSGGSAGLLNASGSNWLAMLSCIHTTSGPAGGSGQTISVAAVSSFNSAHMPGGGGAGSNTVNSNGIAGGTNALGPWPGHAAQQGVGADGIRGFCSWKMRGQRNGILGGLTSLPFICCGGTGGNGSGTGTAGKGGEGFYGCGGGGGGGGVTGREGGKGGDGMVIIACA